MFYRSLIIILYTIAVFKLVQCKIYRLSKNVKPVRYFLTMEPLIDQSVFHGSVIIELKTLEGTNNITLHKKGFNIAHNDIKIVSSCGVEIQLNGAFDNTEAETYTIILKNKLTKNNNYNLTISNFSRNFERNKGFFLKHAYEEGLEISSANIALTHFEPTNARMAFPCFDEPGFKAKFVINLIRREGYHSVSNEVLEKTENLGDGRFKDIFKETPIMSTYAVAFIVTNFKFTETVERHRVFAAPKAIENGKLDYALKVGVKTLQALENFIGFNYTLNKMDQVAAPNFPVHAMENWGLVIYRENFLLVSNTTRAEKLQKTNCYIAHEFAHQWFGNLVTAEWWDYLWVSESFAAYFHYHIADTVEPSWRLKDQFLIEMVHTSFLNEEVRGAYPLNVHIQRPGEYPPLHIMYEKGSAIIRMMEHFLTHNVFKRGIQIYIQKNKFSTVVPSDLYHALQQAVDEGGVNNLLGNMTVAQILTSWDSMESFPIVVVTRNYTTGTITLKQISIVETPRIIPINYVFFSDNKIDFSKTSADYWLTKETVTIKNSFPTDGWILINKQQTGYYRVNYDLENWERLIDYMNSENFTSIHVLNRAQLIDDAFNFAFHKYIPWHIPLRLCDYLVRERDYIPFAAFYNGLHKYVRIHSDDPKNTYKYFQNYTLTNTISENANEYEIYEEYLQTILIGVVGYLESLEESNRTHLDDLHIQHIYISSIQNGTLWQRVWSLQAEARHNSANTRVL